MCPACVHLCISDLLVSSAITSSSWSSTPRDEEKTNDGEQDRWRANFERVAPAHQGWCKEHGGTSSHRNHEDVSQAKNGHEAEIPQWHKISATQQLPVRWFTWTFDLAKCSMASRGAYLIWLVVEPHLWKIWKSVGIIINIPNWKSRNCSKPPTSNLLIFLEHPWWHSGPVVT